jgi:hypothetical protein
MHAGTTTATLIIQDYALLVSIGALVRVTLLFGVRHKTFVRSQLAANG